MASIIIESPRDIKKVIKTVEDYIIKQEIEFNIYTKIMEVFKTFDGKPVSKRMETAVKKIFPDYHIYLENGYLIILHIWGKEITHDNRINIYLRKGKDALNPSAYNHALTLENSGYFPYIPERNEKLKASLCNDFKVIKLLVNDFNEAVATLQGINAEAERYGYPLSSILDLKS
jgi:hypothetical protein